MLPVSVLFVLSCLLSFVSRSYCHIFQKKNMFSCEWAVEECTDLGPYCGWGEVHPPTVAIRASIKLDNQPWRQVDNHLYKPSKVEVIELDKCAGFHSFSVLPLFLMATYQHRAEAVMVFHIHWKILQNSHIYEQRSPSWKLWSTMSKETSASKAKRSPL